VDPLTKDYPWYTPYQFAGNTPIAAVDLDGAEELYYTVSLNEKTKTSSVKLVSRRDGVLCNCTGAHLYINYKGQYYYQSSFPTSSVGKFIFNTALGAPSLEQALANFENKSEEHLDKLFGYQENIEKVRERSRQEFLDYQQEQMEIMAYAMAGRFLKLNIKSKVQQQAKILGVNKLKINHQAVKVLKLLMIFLKWESQFKSGLILFDQTLRWLK
jgi:hypothetical protein